MPYTLDGLDHDLGQRIGGADRVGREIVRRDDFLSTKRVLCIGEEPSLEFTDFIDV